MEIKFENVGFSYHRKNIWEDVNVICKDGEITTFLGDSMSSLSILFSLLSGSLGPTYGSILWDGNRKKPKNIKIGYMKKYPESYLCMQTVREYFSSPCLKKRSDEQKIVALKNVFLDDSYLDRSVSSLSKGEKVKVVLASFLMQDFDVLMIEDPFFFFSDSEKKDIANLMRRIRNQKVILFGTFDTGMAQMLSDFIYVASHNKILQGGPASMVLTDRKLLSRARLKMPPILDFMDTVFLEKGMKMMYRSEINDLIKDIYRDVR